MNAELNRAGLIGVLNVSESTVRRWEEWHAVHPHRQAWETLQSQRGKGVAQEP